MTGPYGGKQIRDAALLLLTGLALFLCWLLAKPFLTAIAWALALAVVAYPLHRRFELFLRPNLAALLSLLAVTIILLAPGALLLQNFFDQASSGAQLIGQNLNPTALRHLAERYPFSVTVLDWLQARFDLSQELKRAAGSLAGQASVVLSGSVQVVTQVAIMLVTLFYFLRDRRLLLEFLFRLAPLSSSESHKLIHRVSEAISATLYGNLVVKLVQGILGGLMFWILGLPSPLLFGILMALLAMLPVVGTSLVWGPAAIVLLYQGSWVKAIILALWGGLVVSLMDNLLYPMLVATGLRFHTLGVLFSLFGGLIAFGLAGFVLGPVILASTVALLEIWQLRTANEDEGSQL
ncbi:MAG TPA: AI-2E family transporter [Bryobacteraceae bacterium]|nr:AI-2E family transporter [Bryobacteraceae bacterium]